MERIRKISLSIAFGVILAIPLLYLAEVPEEVFAQTNANTNLNVNANTNVNGNVNGVANVNGGTGAGATNTVYPLEIAIGDTEEVSNVTDYIQQLYVFLVGAAGIVATVMIMWGGVKWILAAGSGEKISDAKQTIVEAIIGLVLVLVSFVILNALNPQLTTLRFPEVPEIVLETPPAEGSGIFCAWADPTAPHTSDVYPVGDYACSGVQPDGYECRCIFNANCQPTTSGACSPAEMQEYFGDNKYMASAICNAESASDPSVGESCSPGTCTDYCSNDPSTRAFSFGLFQINLRFNPLDLHPSGSMNCRDVFTDYVNLFASEGRFLCTIDDDAAWEDCKNAAIDPDTNKRTAAGLSEGGKYWQDWSTNFHCGFPAK